MLRVLDLPNKRQAELLASYKPGTQPDPTRKARELAKHGVAWTVRDLNKWPINPLSGLHSFFAGLDPIRAITVLLRDRKVDVICCGFESGIFFVLLLRRLFLYKPKIVIFEVNARGWRIRDWLLDYVMPRLDGVLTLTEHQRQATNNTYHLRRPAEVVGWSIDHDFFSPDSDNPDEGYIFSVGDDAGRDYVTLVEACWPLNYRLLLRTSTALPPSGGQAQVIRLGRMSFTELRDCYARARIVVVPLRAISSPTGITSILEAMAMGKAVIASDVGTTQALIVDGVTGLVVPPGDVEALQHAIQRLMGDAALRERLGWAARSAIEGPLSYQDHIRRLADALTQIVNGETPPFMQVEVRTDQDARVEKVS